MKPVTTPAKLKNTGSCGNAPASTTTCLSIQMVKWVSLLKQQPWSHRIPLLAVVAVKNRTIAETMESASCNQKLTQPMRLPQW